MEKRHQKIAVFSGTANLELTEKICKKLALKQGKADIGRFSDGEISVKINENVRGKDVYIIQPTCSPSHVNLIELILMVDALRWSSAGRITAVIPYYGYARQDRRVRSQRVPISAKVIAGILERSGIDRVLTVELHSEQIQGFFDIPVDNIYGTKVIYEDIKKQKFKDILVVTDTIPLSEEAKSCKKIRCISLAPTLAEAIKRLNKEESISEMLM